MRIRCIVPRTTGRPSTAGDGARGGVGLFFGGTELAAAEHRQIQRPEVLRADDPERSSRSLRLGAADTLDQVPLVKSAERDGIRVSRCLDAWHPADAFECSSAKLARANTSTHGFRLPEVPFDIPGEPDHAVDRWLPRTKAVLEEMRALSPRPYRFGSQLALPDFPRKPGVEAAPTGDADADAKPNPFAALAKLKGEGGGQE